jgi:hypothetical protein
MILSLSCSLVRVSVVGAASFGNSLQAASSRRKTKADKTDLIGKARLVMDKSLLNNYQGIK